MMHQDHTSKDEHNSSDTEDARWERLWEPAARHYRPIEHPHPTPDAAGMTAASYPS